MLGGSGSGTTPGDRTEAFGGGVAVFGQTPGADAEDGPQGSGTSPDDPPVATERYREDIPIIIASAILAAAPFLPWYRMKLLGTRTVAATGWETGTWGPMIAFLGLASLALAVFRRVGVRVSLPVADAQIHEAVGWLSIVGAVIKFRAVPSIGNQFVMQGTYGVWITIGAAFILAFLAGRMSSGSPFVTIPGWFRGKAGKIGVAVLAIALIGSVAFGMLNTVDVQKLATGMASTGTTGKPPKQNILMGKFPKCAGAFPRSTDAKPTQGVEPSGATPCVFTYESALWPDQLLTFYKAELPKAGYRFTTYPSQSPVAGHSILLTAPKCGQIALTRQPGVKVSTVLVVLGGQCVSPPPTTRSSPTPSSS